MAVRIRPLRVTRGDVDVARDSRVDFFKARARSKSYSEPP